MGEEHFPVMYREVIEYIKPNERKVIVDCTLGIGSHALKILELLPEDSLYIGIDKDASSLKVARRRLRSFSKKCIFVKDDFRNLDHIIKRLNIIPEVFFFDLGISSYQLLDPKRGFSFLYEGPLDMRIDREAFLCAYDLVNNLKEYELASIFRTFGEERYSYRIAKNIVQRRKIAPIVTTYQLKDCIVSAIPRRYSKIHPATRVFMALRIAVNRELDVLKEGLEKAISLLPPRGRVLVISFHSLEDRIVKHTFKEFASRRVVRLVNKKPLCPLKEEIAINSRSRSAKLRVVEKLKPEEIG